MSVPATPQAGESGSLNIFVRAAVPVVVASAAMALAAVAIRTNALPGEGQAAPPPGSPTPYTEMHERVQQGPGDPQPLPPTF